LLGKLIKSTLLFLLPFSFLIGAVYAQEISQGSNQQTDQQTNLQINTDPRAYLDIARYHMVLGEYSKAADNYEIYISKKDEKEARIEYARALFFAAKIQKGLDVSEKTIERYGRQTDLLLEQATILSLAGRFEQAIKVYEEVLKSDPSNFSAHLGLSYIYLKAPGTSPRKGFKDRVIKLGKEFKFRMETDRVKADQLAETLKKGLSESRLPRDKVLLELAFLNRGIARYDQAEYYFKEYLKLKEDPDARFEYARALNWDKKLPEATDELKIILKKTPDDPKVLRELALYESWLGRTSDAEANFVRVLAKEPDNIEVKLLRAQNLKWGRKNREAYTIYNDVLKNDPENSLARKGIIETAPEQNLLEIIKKNPDDRDAVWALHQIYIRKRDYRADIRLLDNYAKSNPEDGKILEELAHTYMYDNNYKGSIGTSRRLLYIDKNNDFALTSIPELYLWLEDYSQSSKWYGKLKAKRPLTVKERLNYASALKNTGKNPEALALYRSVYAEQPKNAEAMQAFLDLQDTEMLAKIFDSEAKDRDFTKRLTEIYLVKKDYADAIAVLKKHFAQDPEDHESTLMLARVLSWDAKFDESIRLYDELTSKGTTFTGTARLEAAEVSAWAGNNKSAEARFRSLLADEPENVEALTGLSKIYLWTGQREKEKDTYRAILKINPLNMYAMNMLAKAESHPSEQIPILEEKLRTDPKDIESAKKLLALYEETEDYSKAYEIAERFASKNEIFKANLERLKAKRDEKTATLEARISSIQKEIAEKPFSKEPKKELINLYITANRLEDAAIEMQKYLLTYPEDTAMRQQLAEVYSWDGRYVQSGKEYEDLLQKYPGNIHYKLALATVQYWSGDRGYPLALGLIGDILKDDPENGEALIIRGNIYRFTGNYNKALKDYRAILAKEENSEARQGINQILDYGPKYGVDLGFLFRRDNTKFTEITPWVELNASWNRYTDSRLSYSHSNYSKDPNPDINLERLKFTQGLRIGDQFYLDGFFGWNGYLDSPDTYDYGGHLTYKFGWQDHLKIGFENSDILGDVASYESLSPVVIESNYIVLDFVLHPSLRTSINLSSKTGFFSDKNRYFSNSLVFAWTAITEPFLSIYGSLRYLRVNDKLYIPSRYWDPSYYIAVVPGAYFEAPLAKWVKFFTDFQIGYGNEEGSSILELGTDTGFEFLITDFLKARTSGFYSQSGRSVTDKTYYQYGARALLSFGF
jgi:tetratricopeptide (TPR) repeat protein